MEPGSGEKAVGETELYDNEQVNKIAQDIEESYENLFNTISDALYILDHDLRFVIVNNGAQKMYGYSVEEFIGNTPEFLSAPGKNNFQETASMINQAFKGEVQKFEGIGLRKNGEEFPKNVILNKGYYKGKEVVIAIGRDMTDWNKANEALREQAVKLKELNAAKDKFFSIIAHDLKTPFSAILGFSELLSEEYDIYTDEERKRFIGNLNVAAESAFKLLQNLLEWSRTQTGRIEFKPEYIDFSTIVNENLLFFKSQGLTKKIRIASKVEFNTMVFADENMLKTILRNLISNAIKFSYEGGIVLISSTIEGSFVKITVSDHGIGIPEHDIPKLFRIDEKVISEGTSHEAGTGLGLILCKEFVEKHGGLIKVVSKYGEGTQISFTIPRNPFK